MHCRFCTNKAHAPIYLVLNSIKVLFNKKEGCIYKGSEEENIIFIIGIDVSNNKLDCALIEQLISKYTVDEKRPTLLTDIINDLPEISAFKGDPVEIQRTMRNEWD